MAMRITGMNSGLDTEAIIAELVKGEKAKVDTTKKAQISLQWKQDAWKELNSKVLKLFTGTLSNMRFTDAYSKKVTKSSNEDAVTVLTNGTATNGVQDLEIKELAKAGYLTGEKLDSAKFDKKDPSQTTLSALSGGTISGDISFSVTTNGKTKDITLKSSDKISDVVNKLKNAGINASFDANHGRLYLSSKTTGAAADFALTANTEAGSKALTALGINDDNAATLEEYKRIAKLANDSDGKNAWIISDYKKRIQNDITALDADTKSKKVKTFQDNVLTAYRDELKVDLANAIPPGDPDSVDNMSDDDVLNEIRTKAETAYATAIDNANLSAGDKTYLKSIITDVISGSKGKTAIEDAIKNTNLDPTDKANLQSAVVGAIDRIVGIDSYDKMVEDIAEASELKWRLSIHDDIKALGANITSMETKQDKVLAAYNGELQNNPPETDKTVVFEAIKAKDQAAIEAVITKLTDSGEQTALRNAITNANGDKGQIEEAIRNSNLSLEDKAELKSAVDKQTARKAEMASYDTTATALTAAQDKKSELEGKLDPANMDSIIADYLDKAEQYVAGRIDYVANNFELDSNDALVQKSSSTITFSDVDRIKGQDAKITLNGVEYESKNNTFEINGLTITANQKTETGKPISLTTQDDTEGVYDTIKNFIKEYNAIINEMDKLYNAESAKAYQPLTAEEKEAMSESEIETWEKKIKDSILRRDSTLQDVSSTMKKVMMGGVEIGGKNYFLSSFGINTMGYFDSAKNERNAYHIDGDADDAFTAMNNDLLKKMITTDPDKVSAFFSTMAKDLYGSLDKLMKAGDVNDSSKTSLYDDKKWEIEYDAFTTRIKEQEKRVTQVEDKYYRQFSAMETALAKLQSKQSALAGLLGS